MSNAENIVLSKFYGSYKSRFKMIDMEQNHLISIFRDNAIFMFEEFYSRK